MMKIGRHGVRIGVLALVVASTAAAAEDFPTASTPPNDVLEALLRVADRRAEEAGKDAAEARTHLLAQLTSAPFCFVEHPTPGQLDAIAGMYDGLPPSLQTSPAVPRYFLNRSYWETEALPGEPASFALAPIGAARPARRISLSYSFPADGVPWDIQGQAPNDLNARFDAMFGAGFADIGREYIRQSLAVWERSCGTKYYEIPDDDTPAVIGPSNGPTPAAPGNGDIRVGAWPQGEMFGVLAFNYLPFAGGDMSINSTYFPPVQAGETRTVSYTTATANRFRLFRNTISHEHGHGLGFLHVVPCLQTKLMEPFLVTSFDGPQVDELRGAQQNYGDRFTPNQAPETARDLSTLVDATGTIIRAVLERDLSTNGAGVPTGEDWFRFAVEGAFPCRITVTPTGGVYRNGPQTTMCEGEGEDEHAQRAGNLSVELYTDTDPPELFAGTVGQGGLAPAGMPEIINASSLPPGSYLIRVRDIGPNPAGGVNAPADVVQLYNLSVLTNDLGDSGPQRKYLPVVVAGVDKTVRIGTRCQFIGDIHSRSQGIDVNGLPIALRTQQYEWDLDGDGVFEVSANPPPPIVPTEISPPTLLRQPFIIIPTNSVRDVTLRVTDDNGISGTDTIRVTAVGDPITVAQAVPPSGVRGATIIGASIVGTNLGAVQFASQIAVVDSNGDEAGVTVSGTPVASADGTTLTGLTLTIDDTAALGPRDVLVTDWFSRTSLVGGFTVSGTAMPPANDDCGGAFIAVAGTPIPFNNLDATDSSAPSCGAPVPPLFNDVWYAYTAPATGRLTFTFNVPFPAYTAAYESAGCPPGMANLLGCSDGPAFAIDATGGARYLFRVGATAAASEAISGTILVGFDPVGACCNTATGACLISIQTNCGAGSMFQAADGSCTPQPCPQPLGRCCFPDGSCMETTEANCPGGNWLIAATCVSNPCPPPLGSCCLAVDGSCTETVQADCTAGVWTLNAVCDPNPCPPPAMGSCCATDGGCSLRTEGECDTGLFMMGTMCEPGTCTPVAGACCMMDGSCTNVPMAACSGTWSAGTCAATTCPQPVMGSCCTLGACDVVAEFMCGGGFTPMGTCTPNPCPGACCIGASCSTLLQLSCSGLWLGPGTTCFTSPCGPLIGACCSPSGACALGVMQACAIPNTFQGRATVCSPNICPVPTGACCTGTNCSVTLEAVCPGRWSGPNTTCMNPICCQADFDGAGGLTLQDLFDYLGTWLVMDPAAEFDGLPTVTVEDLFAYLTAYFAGCT